MLLELGLSRKERLPSSLKNPHVERISFADKMEAVKGNAIKS